jgi:hypothetical protein
LAGDVRFCSFTLGIQRVKLLFQSSNPSSKEFLNLKPVRPPEVLSAGYQLHKQVQPLRLWALSDKPPLDKDWMRHTMRLCRYAALQELLDSPNTSK